jgi:hypothetical protein
MNDEYSASPEGEQTPTGLEPEEPEVVSVSSDGGHPGSSSSSSVSIDVKPDVPKFVKAIKPTKVAPHQARAIAKAKARLAKKQ